MRIHNVVNLYFIRSRKVPRSFGRSRGTLASARIPNHSPQNITAPRSGISPACTQNTPRSFTASHYTSRLTQGASTAHRFVWPDTSAAPVVLFGRPFTNSKWPGFSTGFRVRPSAPMYTPCWIILLGLKGTPENVQLRSKCPGRLKVKHSAGGYTQSAGVV